MGRLICYVLRVSRHWHFLYCFGFNLKKKNLVEKVNIYNQQLNIWWNNWHLHNWWSRRTRLNCPYFPVKFPLLLRTDSKGRWHKVTSGQKTFESGQRWLDFLKIRIIASGLAGYRKHDKNYSQTQEHHLENLHIDFGT